jgi:hypothetical protein
MWAVETFEPFPRGMEYSNEYLVILVGPDEYSVIQKWSPEQDLSFFNHDQEQGTLFDSGMYGFNAIDRSTPARIQDGRLQAQLVRLYREKGTTTGGIQHHNRLSNVYHHPEVNCCKLK